VDGFVSQSTRSGDNTDLSSLVDVTGHDTDLALLRRDDTRAVGTDESGLVLLDESRLDTDHILGGDTFSNANGKRNFGFDGVKDGVGSEFWGNVDHGSVGASSLSSISNGVKNRDTKMFLATFAGSDTTDDLCTVSNGLLRVVGTLLSGEALNDDLSVSADLEVWSRSVVNQRSGNMSGDVLGDQLIPFLSPISIV
jgi:hypothetical protein